MSFSGGFAIGGSLITNLRYADDTALRADNAEESQEDLINLVNENGLVYGLQLNVNRTETMSVNPENTTTFTANNEN